MNAIPFYGKDVAITAIASSNEKIVIGVSTYEDAKLVFQNISCVDYIICIENVQDGLGVWQRCDNIKEADEFYNQQYPDYEHSAKPFI